MNREAFTGTDGEIFDPKDVPTSSTLMDEIWEPYDPTKHTICSQQIEKEFVLQTLLTYDSINANFPLNKPNVTIKLMPADADGEAPFVQRITT